MSLKKSLWERSFYNNIGTQLTGWGETTIQSSEIGPEDFFLNQDGHCDKSGYFFQADLSQRNENKEDLEGWTELQWTNYIAEGIIKISGSLHRQHKRAVTQLLCWPLTSLEVKITFPVLERHAAIILKNLFGPYVLRPNIEPRTEPRECDNCESVSSPLRRRVSGVKPSPLVSLKDA